MRSPQHRWQLRQQAFQIQPFLIAPVLPGETLKNATMQSRVVTDPVRNPLIGWWIEYYLFYVKHRDMSGSADFQAMMTNPNHDLSAYAASATTTYDYTYDGGIDWVDQCMEAVVNEYFRDEGEDYTDHVFGNLPAAAVAGSGWWDSLQDDSVFKTATTDPDVDLDASGTTTASEVELALRQWQFMREHNLTEKSYEDYLASYGVRQSASERVVPELLKYERNWTYPTNVIDPTDGSPTSACSWAVSMRADKDRFFKEPGFIFGVCVCRPKVYSSSQDGAAVGILGDAFSWIPASLLSDAGVAWKKFDGGATPTAPGPLGANVTPDYWIDTRDLFMHGDQFINFALSDADANLVALPATDLAKVFASDTMSKSFFVDSAGTDFLVKQDGVCALHIASSVRDTSPTTVTG